LFTDELRNIENFGLEVQKGGKMLKKINIYDCAKSHKINTQPNVQSNKFQPGVTTQNANSKNFKSLYYPCGVSFTGLPFLTPKVVCSYRAQLAEAIGVKAESLRSILEPSELKSILKNAKSENFSCGTNFKNVLNGVFGINLHIHTQYSDGKLTIKELLDQSAKYAEYRKALNKNSPVIVAITDHDTIDGAKEAVKIIANNPEKYKDIRVVLGAEFNAKYNSRQVEAVGYCINPFDENLNKFVNSGKEANKQYLKSFLAHVNEWEAKAEIPAKNRTTLETIINHAETKNLDCNKQIRFLGSPGLIKGFITSLKDIFAERGWKMDGIKKFENEHCLKYKSLCINPSTPDLKEIPQMIKKSGGGFVGIAHPCRNLGGLDLRYLFQDFRKIGIDAAEANYQYPINESYFPKSFQEHADLASNINNMIKTGGSDNHTDNIFTNRFNTINLPSPIQDILGSSFVK
jgi:predicted metal-dependent phosphoesterase TrpH